MSTEVLDSEPTEMSTWFSFALNSYLRPIEDDGRF